MSAAGVTRELMEKADLLASRLRRGFVVGAEMGVVETAQTGGESDFPERANPAGSGAVMGPTVVPSQHGFENGYLEFMDWALTVDSFINFEDLFADAEHTSISNMPVHLP